MTATLSFGSLFAGIGGIDLGLERAGMKCSWQVEIDDYCTKVLEKHWPGVERYRNVKETHGAIAHANGIRRDARRPEQSLQGLRAHGETWNSGERICPSCLVPVDLICGGFPCQDVSYAGKRAGLKEGTRTGLWHEFARIIRELRPKWVLAENVPGLLSVDSGRGMGTVLGDLAESGYDAEWDCIPAAAFGAPHLRYRVFIVAHAASTNVKTCSSDAMGNRAQGIDRQYHGSFAPRSLLENTMAHASRKQSRQPHRKQGRQDSSSGSGEGRGITRRNGQEAVAYADGQRRWPSRNRYDTPRIFGGQGLPRTECWWAVEPNVGRVADGIPSRVDRLRALGNAVVPQVAEWIGRRIIEADNGNYDSD